MPQTDRPSGYREPAPSLPGGLAGGDVTVTVGEPAAAPQTAEGGIEVTVNGDGSVTVDTSPAPQPRGTSNGFDENLADGVIADQSLGAIAAEILEGIEADEASRREWVQIYSAGMDMLGLRPETPGTAPNKGTVSTVRHPVLLEAVVRFQSAARAELLPASGPAKVRNDGPGTAGIDALATAFERDLNHYLTVTASEFYPDSDRGLFYLGYGGTLFKKVYRCPLRDRPVSECVYMPDLIVSNEATDLANALRVTHRIMMSRGQIKRLQLEGVYRNVPLQQPQALPDELKQKEASQAGRAPLPARPQDQQHTIYECYAELDLGEYGHVEPDAPPGLPLPWRVTIDRDSRQILDIRRDWKEGDEKFRRRKHFVKYGLIPGFGFYDLGFLHLLGNYARALTAMWRIMIDAGMFANFPGGVKVKGTRQTTNEITPGPGEWQEVDTGPIKDVRQAMMPLPYKDLTPGLLQLSEMIGQDAQRLGQAVEIEVGEGRTNVPVGTMMSMIEQQTQVMQAVHKRLHTAQQEELLLLKDLFAEDPQALSRLAKSPARQWQEAAEFQDVDLVPASDPNVPAQIHRIMQATALSILASQNPDLYNRYLVQKRLLATIRVDDADTLLHDPAQSGAAAQPNPQAIAAMQKLQLDQQKNQIAAATLQERQQDNQRDAQQDALETGAKMQTARMEAEARSADRESRERVAAMQQQTEMIRSAAEMRHEHQMEDHRAMNGAAPGLGLGAPIQ